MRVRVKNDIKSGFYRKIPRRPEHHPPVSEKPHEDTFCAGLWKPTENVFSEVAFVVLFFLSNGMIYNRDGRLVASVAQEGLIRYRGKGSG